MLGDRSGALLPAVETVQHGGFDKFDPLYTDTQITPTDGGIKGGMTSNHVDTSPL